MPSQGCHEAARAFNLHAIGTIHTVKIFIFNAFTSSWANCAIAAYVCAKRQGEEGVERTPSLIERTKTVIDIREGMVLSKNQLTRCGHRCQITLI